jgi:hypothetical protein
MAISSSWIKAAGRKGRDDDELGRDLQAVWVSGRGRPAVGEGVPTVG